MLELSIMLHLFKHKIDHIASFILICKQVQTLHSTRIQPSTLETTRMEYRTKLLTVLLITVDTP